MAWFKDNRESFWKKREQDQGAVVFAGSSSIGNWKTLAWDFPNIKVANRGIRGDTGRRLLFRVQEDILDLHPKAVVILIGQNDLSAHAKPGYIISNLRETLNMAKA